MGADDTGRDYIISRPHHLDRPHIPVWKEAPILAELLGSPFIKAGQLDGSRDYYLDG